MKKKELVLIALIILLSAALLSTFLYIRHIRSNRIAASYVRTIREIDRYISHGATQKAKERIITLADTEVSAATYLQLLKRADQIEDNFATFLEVAKEGYTSYPARSDISALCIYAYLRTEHYEKALEVYRESELDDSRWNPLRAELSLVAAGKEDIDIEMGKSEEDKDKDLYKRVLTSENPEIFEEAWEKTGIKSFLVDAVLLYLVNGDIYRADELASHISTEGFSKLHFFIAYDRENWKVAEKYLQRVEISKSPDGFTEKEHLLFEAELAMRQREYQRAKELYNKIALQFSDEQWRALYNIAFLAYKNREMDTIGSTFDDTGFETDSTSSFLDLLYSTAGENPERVTDLAELMLSFDDELRAEALLSFETVSQMDRAHIRLLREKINETINPERYKSLLRMLVNRKGGSTYAAHLAWFLVGIEDFTGLEGLLDYYRQVYEEQGWLNFYMGILYAENGEYEKALSSFSLSLEENKFWQTYYNMALVASLKKNVSRSISLMETALEKTESNSDGKAIVLAKRAEIRYRNGQYAQAKMDAQNALENDASNTNAQLVLNALESYTSQ